MTGALRTQVHEVRGMTTQVFDQLPHCAGPASRSQGIHVAESAALWAGPRGRAGGASGGFLTACRSGCRGAAAADTGAVVPIHQPPGGGARALYLLPFFDMLNTSLSDSDVSTKAGLFRALEYAQWRRRSSCSSVECRRRAAHSQSPLRNSSRRSRALKRTGFDEGASIRLRAASFIARSASMYWCVVAVSS